MEALERTGLVGWMDSKSFYSPLVAAERQIERAFNRARFHCLLVSARYRSSAWCREEYRLGLRSEADLSIPRVLVLMEGAAAEARVPQELNHAPRFDVLLKNNMTELPSFIARGKETALPILEWTRREGRSKSRLVDFLSKDERLKLVGDHLEYLFQNFRTGEVQQTNHLSGVRLGITSGSQIPGHLVSHASPALACKMCWRWVEDIVGQYSLRKLIAGEVPSKGVDPVVVPAIASLFSRILPTLQFYFSEAASRRSIPSRNSQEELFSIVDYIICGFLALVHRERLDTDEIVGGVRDLLGQVGKRSNESGTAVAEYLSSSLPAIGLPELAVERMLRIHALLH